MRIEKGEFNCLVRHLCCIHKFSISWKILWLINIQTRLVIAVQENLCTKKSNLFLENFLAQNCSSGPEAISKRRRSGDESSK